MATIYKAFHINCSPDHAWAALRDFAHLHERLVKGFVVKCDAHDDLRTITFMNGATVTERLVGIDDNARRLCYTLVGSQTTHHSASAQIFSDGSGTQFVWITDVLPDSLAENIGAMMNIGAKSIVSTLESR